MNAKQLIENLLKKAIDDALNQGHYSFLHPDVMPPMEHNAWREKWIKDNQRLIDSVVISLPD